MTENHQRKVSIVGTVSLALWDDHVETVCITTKCGDEYIVEPGKRAGELLDLLDLRVQASGRVWDDGRRTVLRLSEYREFVGYDEWAAAQELARSEGARRWLA